MTESGNPDAETELVSQGFEFMRLGKYSEARRKFDAALKENSDSARAWAGFGAANFRLKEFVTARTALRKSLLRDQGNWRVIHDYGRACLQLEEIEDAVQALTQAVTINPGAEAAWCDLGTAQMAIGAFADAEYSFRYAISINKKFAVAYHNLANCIRERGEIDDAIRGYRRALDADPDFSAAAIAYASTLSDAGRVQEALEVLNIFLARHPSDAQCHQHKGLILLRAGKLGEGFKEYEWRLTPTPDGVPVRPFSQPQWRRDQGSGKDILVWLEQGVGDEILSLHMLKDVIAETGPCMVECDPRLASIVTRSFKNITVIPRSDPPDPLTKTASAMLPIWSCGSLYRSDLSSFPHHDGYLLADRERTSSLRQKYATLAKGRKIVGVSWSSGGTRGRAKTPPLDVWHPLLEQDDVFFVSLQYAAANSDIETLATLSGRPIHLDQDVDQVNNIDAAAAQIAAMDATVTVSNTTAHLAGALGQPVATLLPSGFGGFWYWFRERTDSPWYPSMTLCRQSEPGNWETAMSRAVEWLRTRV